MPRHPKVNIDLDPNQTHEDLLRAFVGYIQYYEKFHENPSHPSRIACRSYLEQVYKLSKVRKLEIMDLHKKVRAERERIEQLRRERRLAKQKQNQG